MTLHSYTYVSVNDCYAELVTIDDVDPVEMAGIIDRALLPMQGAQQGYVLNRTSGYTCGGNITGKFAQIEIFDECAHIATLAVCMHSRAAKGLWGRITAHLIDNDYADQPPPPAPWAAMRYHVPEIVLPDWLDWWCKSAAWAIIDERNSASARGAALSKS